MTKAGETLIWIVDAGGGRERVRDSSWKPDLQLTGFLRTLLAQVQDDGGKSLGSIAASFAGSSVQNSRKRNQSVRGGLIALEQAGYIETVAINPRCWRITPEGRAAIS